MKTFQGEDPFSPLQSLYISLYVACWRHFKLSNLHRKMWMKIILLGFIPIVAFAAETNLPGSEIVNTTDDEGDVHIGYRQKDRQSAAENRFFFGWIFKLYLRILMCMQANVCVPPFNLRLISARYQVLNDVKCTFSCNCVWYTCYYEYMDLPYIMSVNTLPTFVIFRQTRYGYFAPHVKKIFLAREPQNLSSHYRYFSSWWGRHWGRSLSYIPASAEAISSQLILSLHEQE